MLIENYDRIFWSKNIDEHGETCHSRSDLGGESDNIYIYIHSRKSDLYEIYSHEKLQTVLLLNVQFILNVASAGFLRISYSYCFREQHPGGNYCLG